MDKKLLTFFFLLFSITMSYSQDKKINIEELISSCDNNDCLQVILTSLKSLNLATEIINSIPNELPINIQKIELSSIYGNRYHPIDKKLKKHRGIDLKADLGTIIFAPANGEIILRKESNLGYGNRLKIKHKYGFITFYAHLSIILVKQGQKVKKGDIIALVGNSGKSTAPHLHYEIFKNRVNINPDVIIKTL